MDCDDFMLLLAMPALQTRSSKESAGFAVHEAECHSCRELAIQLQDDSLNDDDNGDLSEHADVEIDELIGATIGAYTIRKLIGSGGMGRVYLAVHPEIGSRVAIKVFSKDWNAHPKLVARFFAEAHATNVIAHENIVNVLDVGRLDDQRPYMMMEHLSGWPLSRLVGAESLTDQRIGQIMLDVLSALSAAHDHQIIHRDLKPDNIFISPEGRATLLDFGIAKLVPEIIGDSAPTATGTVLGTPHYMSPEQAVGDPVDTRTDVYAMGIILYECFTGRRPFQGTSLYRLLDQHVNRTPIPPCSIRPELDPNIEVVIAKAMAKRPAERYGSTGEMRAALAACAGIQGDFNTGPQPKLSTSPSASTQEVTFETVANRPKNTFEPATTASGTTIDDSSPQPRRRILPWIGAGVIAALGAAVAIGAVMPENNKSGERLGSMALDAGLLATAPLDASPARIALDSGTIVDIETTLDASVEIASIPPLPETSIIRPRPTPVKLRRKGIAPLSLLSDALSYAQNSKEDAILSRIEFAGLNAQGGVELGKPRHYIVFDFLSPVRAQHYSDKKFGQCIVRVKYTSKGNPEVSSVTGRCSRIRGMTRPRCSMAKFLRDNFKSGMLPQSKSPIDATFKVFSSRPSSRSKPRWEMIIDRKTYKIPRC